MDLSGPEGIRKIKESKVGDRVGGCDSQGNNGDIVKLYSRDIPK